MKVMLLDAAFSAMPIYDALVQAGHEVWVMGARAQDLLARKAGERWVEQDYSRVDEVRRHIDHLGVDAVVPGCTDVSLDTAVALRMNGGYIDSPATNELLANKKAFRKLCAELDLPAPGVHEVSAFPRAGRFICKPVDAFSGRGISTFDGENVPAMQEALRLASAASRSGGAIIEDFAQGPLHSCSAFLMGGRVSQAFYVIEGSSANPYAVDTSHVVHHVPDACKHRLETSLGRLATHLQLCDGLLHVQFIMDGEKPFIIEVARRCPGDLYALLIEYSTGYAYAAAYAACFLGERHATAVNEQRHVLRHTVTSMTNAVYDGLHLRQPQPVRAFFPIQLMGQDMYERQQSRSGVLFTEYRDEHALHRGYELFMARRAYDVSWGDCHVRGHAVGARRNFDQE